jgi:hypothetical protein
MAIRKRESQKNYVYVHPWWSDFQILIWKKNQKWEKNDSKKWKKADERLKPWSLLFGLNCFTHELIDPQTNKILLIIWGQTMSQEMLKFFIIDLKIFLASTPSLKQA